MGIMGRLGERAARVAKGVSSVATSGISSGVQSSRKNAASAIEGVIETTGHAKKNPYAHLPRPPRPHAAPRARPMPPRMPKPNSLPVPYRGAGGANLPVHVPHSSLPPPPKGRRMPYGKFAAGAAVVGGGVGLYRGNKKRSAAGQGLPPGSQTGIYGM